MDTKYFAYYIPENTPILMNNIIDSLKEDYDPFNAQIINDVIESNMQVNDWNPIISVNINQYLNSIVLVKFTLVNDIFRDADTNADANSDTDEEVFNTKYSTNMFNMYIKFLTFYSVACILKIHFSACVLFL